VSHRVGSRPRAVIRQRAADIMQGELAKVATPPLWAGEEEGRSGLRHNRARSVCLPHRKSTEGRDGFAKRQCVSAVAGADPPQRKGGKAAINGGSRGSCKEPSEVGAKAEEA